MVHPYVSIFFHWRFCLPIPFQFRKHKGHALEYDVKNVVPAEVIKNYVKYIFVGRCLLILVTRQSLI